MCTAGGHVECRECVECVIVECRSRNPCGGYEAGRKAADGAESRAWRSPPAQTSINLYLSTHRELFLGRLIALSFLAVPGSCHCSLAATSDTCSGTPSMRRASIVRHAHQDLLPLNYHNISLGTRHTWLEFVLFAIAIAALSNGVHNALTMSPWNLHARFLRRARC